MKTHELKIESIYLESIKSDQKTCELRKNDRDYQAGDKINFVDDNGLFVSAEITHVLYYPLALKDGFVALSIKLIK